MDRYSLILFDFDGVLIDSTKDIAVAVNAALEHFGLGQVSEDQVHSFVGDGAKMLIVRCLDAVKAEAEKLEEVLSWYKDYYNAHATVFTTLYDGVEKVLDFLKDKGKKIGLVSNKPEKISRTILEFFGLDGFFEVIIGPESAGKTKPAPDGIMAACRKTGIPAEKTLMVGDSAVDIMAAKAASTGSCGFTRGIGDRNAMLAQKPDHTIDALTKLMDLV